MGSRCTELGGVSSDYVLKCHRRASFYSGALPLTCCAVRQSATCGSPAAYTEPPRPIQCRSHPSLYPMDPEQWGRCHRPPASSISERSPTLAHTPSPLLDLLLPPLHRRGFFHEASSSPPALHHHASRTTSPHEPRCITSPCPHGSRIFPPLDPRQLLDTDASSRPTPLASSPCSSAVTTLPSPSRSLCSPPRLLRLALTARYSFSSRWCASCSAELLILQEGGARGGSSAGPACSWGDVWVAAPFDDNEGHLSLQCSLLVPSLQFDRGPQLLQFCSEVFWIVFNSRLLRCSSLPFFENFVYGCVVVILHLVFSHCCPLWR